MDEAKVSCRVRRSGSMDSPAASPWCGASLPPVAVERTLTTQERVFLCSHKRWGALPPPAAAEDVGRHGTNEQQGPLAMCSYACSRWNALPPPAAAADEGPLSIDEQQASTPGDARWSECSSIWASPDLAEGPLAVEAVGPSLTYSPPSSPSQNAEYQVISSSKDRIDHARASSRRGPSQVNGVLPRLHGSSSLSLPKPPGDSEQAAHASRLSGRQQASHTTASKPGSLVESALEHRIPQEDTVSMKAPMFVQIAKMEMDSVGVTALVKQFKAATHEPVKKSELWGASDKPQKSSEKEPCSELLRLDAGCGWAERERASEMWQYMSLSKTISRPSRNTSNEVLKHDSSQWGLARDFNWTSSLMHGYNNRFSREILNEKCRLFWDNLISFLATHLMDKWLAISLCYLMVFIISAFIVFIVTGGNWLGDKLLLVEDAPMRGDPNYLIDFFGGQCVHVKSVFRSELVKLEAFNRRWGWHNVTFPARGDSRSVSALYFPSPRRRSPRVVIAHRGAANYLDSSAQTVAYYLRSMNISALIPNLRSHGGQGGPNRIAVKWANQYRDLLGAWDYAVGDPQGLLGGQLEPSLVGILGFEFGGLASQYAFSKEPLVPALFLDGIVHDARELLKRKMEARSPALAWLFEDQAWTRWKALLDQDLDQEESVSLALTRRTSGSLGIVHTVEEENLIQQGQRDKLLETLALSPKIELLMQWYTDFGASEVCAKRSLICQDRPREYKAVLCAFWSAVFDGPQPPGVVIHDRCQPFEPPPSEASWRK